VRGLVLDPAVAREFEGLRRSCEEKSRLVLGLKEEAEGLAFTQVKGARGKGVDGSDVGDAWGGSSGGSNTRITASTTPATHKTGLRHTLLTRSMKL
jgi:hypothetical protein